MGAGVSNSRSRDISVCLDEDVFGKINNQLPNTAVPIEIKPKKRLNGGHKRVSLRGDSVNRSSSFFSNLSSNKNGSFVSCISINKSEFKRQNEILKVELNDIKNKMSNQIQTLLSSNRTLRNQNVNLKSEIDKIKSSHSHIQEELLYALDNQLAMRENVQFYQHKVNELTNVITVQGKGPGHAGSSHYGSYMSVVNNQIISTFLEFMISPSKQHDFKLNTFNRHVIKKNIVIYCCSSIDDSMFTKSTQTLLTLFAQLIPNFVLTNIELVTRSLPEAKEKLLACDALIIIDISSCSCAPKFGNTCDKPVHVLSYSPIKKSCSPITEMSRLITIYNVYESTFSLDVQLLVIRLWDCDPYSLTPLVFDTASFFSFYRPVKITETLAHTRSKNNSFGELDFYVTHVKKSLYVSCSSEAAINYMAHLEELFKGELVVFHEVRTGDTYNDLTQVVLSNLFYQVGLDSKFVKICNQSLFDVIDNLSLYFRIIMVISVKCNISTQCLERFLLLQKRSQSTCIIFGTSVFVQVIQQCDSVYLSESHIPALKIRSQMRNLKSLLSMLDSPLYEEAQKLAQLLTIFRSGLYDSCLMDLVGVSAAQYFLLKGALMELNVIESHTFLVTLTPEMGSSEGLLVLRKLIPGCVSHITNCKCVQLHLRDLPNLLEVSRSREVAYLITRNPEALAFHLYHNSASLLLDVLKRATQMNCSSLAAEFLGFYEKYPSSERILIYRIISQIFYSEKQHYESRLFGKLAEDLEVYQEGEPCFSSLSNRAKLTAQKHKLCVAELQLHETFSYARVNKFMNEAVQILLVQSGILRTLEDGKCSKKCFDRACLVFQYDSELLEVEKVLGYCTLLNVIQRHDIVESVFQNLVSKLDNTTSHQIVCLVLTNYASFHISNTKLSCAVPLLEYLRNTPHILVEPYKTRAFRMLALCHLKLGDTTEAIDVYRILLGKEVRFSKLSDRHMFEDVYNYVLALIKRKYFGSAYDIVKSMSEHIPEQSRFANEYRVRVTKVLLYLRTVISKCKPNSGHYRAAVFL